MSREPDVLVGARAETRARESGTDTSESTSDPMPGEATNRPILALALLATLAVALPRPFLLVFLAVYPAAAFTRVTWRNLAVAAPLMVTANAGMAVVVTALLRIARVPIRPVWLVVALTLVVAARYVNLRYRRPTGAWRWEPPACSSWVIATIYALFVAAVVVRVVSTFGIIAPIQYDPVTHAFFTNRILDEHTIGYFYAPGLHVLSALVVEGSGLTTALAVHYTTNIASALTILSWPAAVWIIFRSRMMTVALAFLMFVGPYPERLYLEQGKNAFVLVSAMLPILGVVLHWVMTRPTRLHGSLLGGAFVAVLFSHQGTALYAAFLVAFGILGAALVRRGDRARLLRLVRSAAWAAAIVAAIVGSWLSLGLSDVDLGFDALVDSYDYGHGYLQGVRAAIGEVGPALRRAPYRSILDLVPLALLAVGVLAISRRGSLRSGTLLVAATGFLTPVLVPFLGLPLLNYLSRETGSLVLFPLAMVVFAGAIAAVIQARSRTPSAVAAIVALLVVTAGFTSIAHGRHTYREIHATSLALPVLTADDLAVFEWIDANLPPGTGIINNAFRGRGIRSHVIFPSDGGMWLPIYTSAEISMDFVTFASRETHRNFDLYDTLTSPDEAVAALRRLNALGYHYFYQASRNIYRPPLDIEQLSGLDGIVVEEAFASGPVAIYRLEAER